MCETTKVNSSSIMNMHFVVYITGPNYTPSRCLKLTDTISNLYSTCKDISCNHPQMQFSTKYHVRTIYERKHYFLMKHVRFKHQYSQPKMHFPFKRIRSATTRKHTHTESHTRTQNTFPCNLQAYQNI